MNSSLIKRIISAVVGILILCLAHFFFQAKGIYIICTIASMLLAYECGSLSFKSKKDFSFLLPLHFIHFVSFYFYPNLNNIFFFLLTEILLWMWVFRLKADSEEPFYTNHGRLYEFLFYSLVAPTFLLAHLVGTAHFESLYFVFFIVASFDTLSYFWGRLLGGKVFSAKLYPISSPSKTIEGALFAGLSCVPLTLVLDQKFSSFSFLQNFDSPIVKIALTSLLLLAALTGDLTESVIKRSAKIKDSGSFLPGHGGFFDRLDGMLFASILSYLLLQS